MNYASITTELNPSFVAGYKIKAECRRYMPVSQRWTVQVLDGFEYKAAESLHRASKEQARIWISEKSKEYRTPDA